MSRHKQLGEALARKRQHNRERFNQCVQLAEKLANTLRLDFGIDERDRMVIFRPLNSEEPRIFPMEMALSKASDGYHVRMILIIKDPTPGATDHRIGFKLRFQEKGETVYGVYIQADIPELTIDLADESTYSLFSDAIFNRVMSHFSTDGEDNLDIQPTGVPN